MPRPRSAADSAQTFLQTLWRKVLYSELWASRRLALLLRLTPLALLLPILAALQASWGSHAPAEASQRYFAAPAVPALPGLHATDCIGAQGLLGDLPPPVAHPAWLPRCYPALTLWPARRPVRSLALSWLGRRQLEGG